MKTKFQIISMLILFFLLTFFLPLMAQDGAGLIESIMYQEFDKAKELIENGVDVNYQDKSSGSTALMLACQYNFIEIAAFLIENKADLNVQAKNGQTALMAAAGSSEDLFNLLLSKGADIKIKETNGTTVLTQACMGVITEKVTLNVVKTILDKGIDVNEAPSSGRTQGYTCLMMAARNNQLKLAKILINRGADVNIKANDGNTALGLARKENNTEITELLIKQGAKE